MKVCSVILLITTVVFVECGHTFIGTNVMRQQMYHKAAQYSAKPFQKRIEYVNYTLPGPYEARIQGILAYDLTYTGASANVTQGGIGYNFVTLRLKSDKGKKLNYDIYIYS